MPGPWAIAHFHAAISWRQTRSSAVLGGAASTQNWTCGRLRAPGAAARKTILRAPSDGIVSAIVAEVGGNIHAGQPVLAIEAAGKQWLSFNVHGKVRHARGHAGPLSPKCGRSELRRLGTPNAWSAITIAIRCGYALTRPAT